MNTTDAFIAQLCEVMRSRFADTAITAARERLLDYLGVTLAGSAMIREKAGKLLDSVPLDPPVASVIGFNRKGGLQTAALVNGMSAHAAELDDGQRFGMIHPGAPVISAVLAVVEARRLEADDLFRGMIIGYEAAISLATALQPKMKDRGFHATGTCGAIGAAMGVAATLRFSQAEMKATLAVAATSASGLLKVIRDASELKPYNAGQAAHNGLLAALVGQSGFAGPEDVLGGDDGFMHVMGAEAGAKLPARTDDLPLAIERVYVKPYAACRHCHAPIEAALRLRAAHDIQPQDVSLVRVATHRWAVHLHDHHAITGVTSAKMSVPYSVAVALNTGKAGLNEFSANQVRNPTTLRLTEMVQVEADDDLTALVPRIRAAVVEITTSTGQVHRERVDLPKGEPEHPLSQEELKEKFLTLAAFAGKSPEQARQIIQTVASSEQDLTPLFNVL